MVGGSIGHSHAKPLLDTVIDVCAPIIGLQRWDRLIVSQPQPKFDCRTPLRRAKIWTVSMTIACRDSIFYVLKPVVRTALKFRRTGFNMTATADCCDDNAK